MNKQQGSQHHIQHPTGSHCMRQQHRWIRQQLICCFIHTYTQAHHFPPTVREIGAWVGCPGMRSLQRALADLERHQYLTRDPHRRHSIGLTAKGITLAQRWQLLVPVSGTGPQTLHMLMAASSSPDCLCGSGT